MTSRTRFLLPALCLFLSVQGAAMAGEVVAEFKGSASRTTPEFEVEAPWLLEWRVSADGNYQVGVNVSLERAGTGIHEGSVLKTKWPGNGARLFDTGGKFQFRVDSALAGWTLRVEQLTEAEAKLYTPREREGMIDN